jgi:hypothetical protein
MGNALPLVSTIRLQFHDSFLAPLFPHQCGLIKDDSKVTICGIQCMFDLQPK